MISPLCESVKKSDTKFVVYEVMILHVYWQYWVKMAQGKKPTGLLVSCQAVREFKNIVLGLEQAPCCMVTVCSAGISMLCDHTTLQFACPFSRGPHQGICWPTGQDEQEGEGRQATIRVGL